jgi:hypothetical protein
MTHQGKVVTIYLSEDLKAKLEAEAKRQDISLSSCLKVILTSYLWKLEDERKAKGINTI